MTVWAASRRSHTDRDPRQFPSLLSLCKLDRGAYPPVQWSLPARVVAKGRICIVYKASSVDGNARWANFLWSFPNRQGAGGGRLILGAIGGAKIRRVRCRNAVTCGLAWTDHCGRVPSRRTRLGASLVFMSTVYNPHLGREVLETSCPSLHRIAFGSSWIRSYYQHEFTSHPVIF